MIIYNPHNELILRERLKTAETILNSISAKHCFITGSFLHKEKFNDIDIFVISRSKKEININKLNYKNINISIIDFNDLYSLFYHSVSKSCVSKNILPQKTLKVTISDYWNVINEAIPTLLNDKNKFHKNIRFLILYTEYFRTKEVLDTFQLSQKIEKFKNCNDIIKYIKTNIKKIIKENAKPSYIKRFFYTQAGFYKDSKEYEAQNILYDLTHNITRGIENG